MAYRQRLRDRFGELPHQAEELLHVVSLRKLGKNLGCEKIMLKQGRMFLCFVSNSHSPFYQSDAFGRILDFVGKNIHRCNFREVAAHSSEKGVKRSMVVADVPTVGEAVNVMNGILGL